MAMAASRGRRERALVLAVLVGEDPVLERPVVALRRRASGAGGGLDRFVVGGLLFAPWNAASWWTIRSVPGVTYLLMSAGSTVRANWPQIGHWKSVHTSSVTGASALPRARPSASATGVGLAGVVKAVASALVGRLPSRISPTTTSTPTPPTTAVIRRTGDRHGRASGSPRVGRPAAAFGASGATGGRAVRSCWLLTDGSLADDGHARARAIRSPRRERASPRPLGRRQGRPSRIRGPSGPPAQSRRGRRTETVSQLC